MAGSDQGCDNDISTVVTRLNQLPLGKMYTKGMVLLMQMTDELLNEDHQAYCNGGNATLRSSRGKDGSRGCQNITNGAKLAEGARLYASSSAPSLTAGVASSLEWASDRKWLLPLH